jgi:hypothetical protein
MDTRDEYYPACMTKIERFAELLKKGEARHVSEWGRILNVTVPTVYGMVKSLAKNHGVNTQKSKGIISLSGSGEGASFAATSTGNSYFSKTATEGMWYHGFAYTPGKSNMQSFTVDTSKMIDEQYLFYVRLPQARPIDPGIYRYRDSSLLKVDVYLPENDTIEQHFALPAQTFYLNAALSSPNASAPLWHTFNIKRDGPNAAAKIVPVQKIITEWRNI